MRLSLLVRELVCLNRPRTRIESIDRHIVICKMQSEVVAYSNCVYDRLREWPAAVLACLYVVQFGQHSTARVRIAPRFLLEHDSADASGQYRFIFARSCNVDPDLDSCREGSFQLFWGRFPSRSLNPRQWKNRAWIIARELTQHAR